VLLEQDLERHIKLSFATGKVLVIQNPSDFLLFIFLHGLMELDELNPNIYIIFTKAILSCQKLEKNFKNSWYKKIDNFIENRLQLL